MKVWKFYTKDWKENVLKKLYVDKWFRGLKNLGLDLEINKTLSLCCPFHFDLKTLSNQVGKFTLWECLTYKYHGCIK